MAEFLVVMDDYQVTGASVERATAGMDSAGLPVVDFVLDDDGARRLGGLTSTNVNRQLAIIVDGTIRAAPQIRAAISKFGRLRVTLPRLKLTNWSICSTPDPCPAGCGWSREEDHTANSNDAN